MSFDRWGLRSVLAAPDTIEGVILQAIPAEGQVRPRARVTGHLLIGNDTGRRLTFATSAPALAFLTDAEQRYAAELNSMYSGYGMTIDLGPGEVARVDFIGGTSLMLEAGKAEVSAPIGTYSLHVALAVEAVPPATGPVKNLLAPPVPIHVRE